MDKQRASVIHYLIIVLTIFLYFYLRLFYKNGIFFDFDMPRVALIVQDFLKHGTFLTSQSYMQESCWLNVPWGPALVFFYTFFLKISPDPLVVSDLLTVFHFLGIVLIIKLGWRYFSPTVGVVAGLLLATNPYWVTYSRIIYQPAPVITFVVISMYLLLSSVKDGNKISTILLPLSWAVLIQMYLPTYSFILIGLVFLLFSYKKIHIRYLLIGLVLSLILFIPSIKFYIENPIYVNRFIEAPSRFTPPEKTFIERLGKVTTSFLQIPMGGKFEWQTGYAYDDFVNSFKPTKVFSLILPVLFSIVLITNLLKMLFKKMNAKVLVIFLWAFCPIWSLMILWVSELVPRYFLISIPPSILLVALFVDDLLNLVRNSRYSRYVILLIPVIVSIYWSVFALKYDYFIGNYSYDYGTFPDVAGSPYKLLKSAMNWIQLSARADGCDGYVLSDNQNKMDYDIWMQTKYVWEYLYKNTYVNADDKNKCYFLLTIGPVSDGSKITEYKKFGPYYAYRYR